MDLIGALAGLILCSFLTFWSAGLAVTATFIFGITNVTRTNLANLLPVINAGFHLFAYAILTVLWIQCKQIFSAIKASNTKLFILSMAGPTGFLIIVKTFSVMAGKDLTFSDIIIAFGAIIAVVTIFYYRALFHKTQDLNAKSRT
jgi:hypothetical protein